MSLRLSTDSLQTIQAHAERTYPNECCGLLLGRGTNEKTVAEIREVQNSWDEQVAHELNDASLTTSDRYWIDPKEMLAGMRDARSRNLDIIGIYHSHPDHPAVPSERDRQLAWSQYSYLIVSVVQGQAIDRQSWTLDDHHHFQSEALESEEPARM